LFQADIYGKINIIHCENAMYYFEKVGECERLIQILREAIEGKEG